jgi:CrcB protein
VKILLISGFGVLGTLARYYLQGVVSDRTSPDFPYGTLVVNLTACLALGAVVQYALRHISFPADWRTAITVGFFGAYSTFSTFSYETIKMLEEGQWTRAAAYLGGSIIGGLAAIWLGMRLGSAL